VVLGKGKQAEGHRKQRRLRGERRQEPDRTGRAASRVPAPAHAAPSVESNSSGYPGDLQERYWRTLPYVPFRADGQSPPREPRVPPHPRERGDDEWSAKLAEVEERRARRTADRLGMTRPPDGPYGARPPIPNRQQAAGPARTDVSLGVRLRSDPQWRPEQYLSSERPGPSGRLRFAAPRGSASGLPRAASPAGDETRRGLGRFTDDIVRRVTQPGSIERSGYPGSARFEGPQGPPRQQAATLRSHVGPSLYGAPAPADRASATYTVARPSRTPSPTP
jgi:hypothetical protein